MSNHTQGWIGVDLDGTLAKYQGWNDGEIGEPVPEMLARVRRWVAEGKTVKIVTARVAALYLMGVYSEERQDEASDQARRIRAWTKMHVGVELSVTAVKDFAMIELWDDRCVSVEPNTGRVLTEGR